MSVTSLAEFKADLNITRAANDAKLQRFLNAAEAHVAKLCGPLAVTATLRARATASGALVLPATSLAAVTAVRDPAGVTVPVNSCEVDLLAAIVRPPRRAAGVWSVDVVREPLDPDLQQAIFIIAGHLWDTQRGNAPASVLQGEEINTTSGAGYAIPNRAATLLAPFELLGFA